MNLQQLKQLYRDGENIGKILRKTSNMDVNDERTIEIMYDLQAGSYVSLYEDDPAHRKFRKSRSQLIAKKIQQYCPDASSILEPGVGEATTLSGVLQNLGHATNLTAFGLDISYSRVHVARTWLHKNDLNAELVTADLMKLPFADSSFDVIYTSHAIEPNGGREKEILSELLRVSGRYLILIEPDYENAPDAGKSRMDTHGYCKGLIHTLKSLDANVLEHYVLPDQMSPLNPSAITVIETGGITTNQPTLRCPESRSELQKIAGGLLGKMSGRLYPVYDGIPCLRADNSVIASIFM